MSFDSASIGNMASAAVQNEQIVCNTDTNTNTYTTEMQKLADIANISVLFFKGGADFWARGTATGTGTVSIVLSRLWP